MTSQLNSRQRALAQAMGDISERGYSASWLDRLEFLLWHHLITNDKKIGRITLTEEEKESLRSLASECGGWIIFDDIEAEEFGPLPRWKQMYAEWFAASAQFIPREE